MVWRMAATLDIDAQCRSAGFAQRVHRAVAMSVMQQDSGLSCNNVTNMLPLRFSALTARHPLERQPSRGVLAAYEERV